MRTVNTEAFFDILQLYSACIFKIIWLRPAQSCDYHPSRKTQSCLVDIGEDFETGQLDKDSSKEKHFRAVLSTLVIRNWNGISSKQIIFIWYVRIQNAPSDFKTEQLDKVNSC